MILTGHVVSGLGRAAANVDAASADLARVLGGVPFPGTLNVRLAAPFEPPPGAEIWCGWSCCKARAPMHAWENVPWLLHPNRVTLILSPCGKVSPTGKTNRSWGGNDVTEIVVITGANNGIGYHMAAALFEQGCKVAALDLSGENLASLSGAGSGELAYVRCDVTSEAEVQAAVDQIIGRWGAIDVLVNNACLAIFRSFEEKRLADTQREFDVNYFGYVRMIAAVLPHMKARGRGIIHNVSSGVGVTGFAGIYGYASTKGAIEALTRTLALELAPYGIQVNLMHPPLTRTRSTAPLGVPEEIKADPAQVGRALAKRILVTKPDVTPGWQAAAFLWLSRWYPNAIGRLLDRATQRAAAAQKGQTGQRLNG